jgi:hypothetical protein
LEYGEDDMEETNNKQYRGEPDRGSGYQQVKQGKRLGRGEKTSLYNSSIGK